MRRQEQINAANILLQARYSELRSNVCEYFDRFGNSDKYAIATLQDETELQDLDVLFMDVQEESLNEPRDMAAQILANHLTKKKVEEKTNQYMDRMSHDMGTPDQHFNSILPKTIAECEDEELAFSGLMLETLDQKSVNDLLSIQSRLATILKVYNAINSDNRDGLTEFRDSERELSKTALTLRSVEETIHDIFSLILHCITFTLFKPTYSLPKQLATSCVSIFQQLDNPLATPLMGTSAAGVIN